MIRRRLRQHRRIPNPSGFQDSAEIDAALPPYVRQPPRIENASVVGHAFARTDHVLIDSIRSPREFPRRIDPPSYDRAFALAMKSRRGIRRSGRSRIELAAYVPSDGRRSRVRVEPLSRTLVRRLRPSGGAILRKRSCRLSTAHVQ